jgi:hypothetical protein
MMDHCLPRCLSRVYADIGGSSCALLRDCAAVPADSRVVRCWPLQEPLLNARNGKIWVSNKLQTQRNEKNKSRRKSKQNPKTTPSVCLTRRAVSLTRSSAQACTSSFIAWTFWRLHNNGTQSHNHIPVEHTKTKFTTPKQQ